LFCSDFENMLIELSSIWKYHFAVRIILNWTHWRSHTCRRIPCQNLCYLTERQKVLRNQDYYKSSLTGKETKRVNRVRM
jgi:hypothetical protein